MRIIPKTSFLGKKGLREETNTTSRPIKPTNILSAAKSDEEEYRRATFMTTQLYPQIRTSTMRDRIAAFCEEGAPDISVLFISRLVNKSSFPGYSKRTLPSSRKAGLRAGMQMQVKFAKSRLRGFLKSLVENGFKPSPTTVSYNRSASVLDRGRMRG